MANIEKLPQYDISNEEYRVYHYPDGETLRVEGAVTLILEKRADGDRHRLIVQTPVRKEGWYIRPGWTAISWSGKDGSPAIEF